MRLVSYLIMSLTTELCLTAEELKRVIEESGHMDSQTDEFYQELIDNGIESLEMFEESYQGQYITEGDFVEQILDECYQCDLPSWVHIDYQRTWDDSLRFDYFSVQTGAFRYEIFRNI